MKSTALTALLLSIATPGHGAAEPQDFPGLPLGPASLCYTYATTYLATCTTDNPIPTFSVNTSPYTLPPFANGTGLHPLPSQSGPGVTQQTLPSSLIQPSSVPPTTVETSTQPSGTVASEDIILRIVPEIVGQKRSLAKRDAGGFINSGFGIDPNPHSCTDASHEQLVGGQLIVEGEPLFADPSSGPVAFRGRGLPPEDSVTTTFENIDGYLEWNDDELEHIRFCQVTETGQVYITFHESEDDWPVGCEPVLLQIFFGKSAS